MRRIDPAVVYSPDYDLHLMGLERFHPFDGRKYSKAYRLALKHLGSRLKRRTIRPARPIETHELLAVHTETYLSKLKAPGYAAEVVELPLLRSLPGFVIEARILRPIRLGVMGTLLAAQEALQNGVAINLAGGYHHASRERGEGFCFFADINIAIAALRQAGGLVPGRDRILIVDLDAHQGNGHERVSVDDPDVFILDMYNRAIYPQDHLARRRINVDVPLAAGTQETVYLQQLRKNLPVLLKAAGQPGLAFYVAGTDIFEQDPLGGLGISAEGIAARDRIVLTTLVEAGVPVVMLAGGGYSRESYEHLANAVEFVFETWPAG
jgi:histone deacetylase 11